MTDRELLEQAAKAEGIEIKFYGGVCKKLFRHICDNNFFDSFAWNPLEDDGDALRLAVKLNMHVDPFEFDDGTSGCDVFIHPASDDIVHTVEHGEKYAATRRAIVRAAAELGRSMK